MISPVQTCESIVNRYMDIILTRDPETICAFRSFLYQSLCYNGYSSVRHWTNEVNLFVKHKIFIPVFINGLWSLVYININTRTLAYYNSFDKMHHGDSVIHLIIQYLLDDLRDKYNKRYLPGRSWALQKITDWPDELNEFSSAILLCKYADNLSKDEPIWFTPSNISVYTSQVMNEITPNEHQHNNF